MRSSVAAAALALMLSGCGHARCPAQPIGTPAQALASMRRPRVRIETMRAEATVDQRGREGRVKGRVLMFAQRPDHVRFDVMTQFGPVLILSADGERIALNDLKQGRFFTGPSCARNIARLIGVALEPEDVVSVLFGEAPAVASEAGQVSCGQGAYALARTDERGQRQVLELGVLPQDRDKPPAEQHTYLRSASLFDAQGRALFRVRYEDYANVGGGVARFPHTIRIEDLVNQADALVRFKSIDLNVKVPDGAFVQEPAPALLVDQLSCD